MTDLLARSKSQLVSDGFTERRLRDAIGTGELLRLRAGRYVTADEWNGAYAEERERVLAHAAQAEAQAAHVFSHATAAAIHGLPLIRHRTRRAHVMVGQASRSGATPGLQRHRDEWGGDVTTIDGLRVTTLARTAFDVLRSERSETAVTVIDAAMRRAATRPDGRVDPDMAEAFREDVLSLVTGSSGKRGIKQARRLLEFADVRAESPGESVSRLYFAELGYAPVRVQVPVASPNGGTYFVDFEVSGVLGEFDGAGKYIDPALRGDASAERVVLREKRREDWIRGRTGRRMIRWTNDEIAGLVEFQAYLRAMNLWR